MCLTKTFKINKRKNAKGHQTQRGGRKKDFEGLIKFSSNVCSSPKGGKFGGTKEGGGGKRPA